jgi:hypothetical protein
MQEKSADNSKKSKVNIKEINPNQQNQMVVESSQPQKPKEESPVVKILALLNQLSLSAYRSQTKQSLIFQILNDTVQLAHYDRAALIQISPSAKVLGISGQVQVNKNSVLVQQWKTLATDLKDPNVNQLLTEDSFQKNSKLWKELSESKSAPEIQWFPLIVNKDVTLGLWLERWQGKRWSTGEIDVLNFLVQAYAAAYEKHLPKVRIKRVTKRQVMLFAAVFVSILFFVHIPLRIVAPCEVVPKNPILLTAPLDGIVADILVKPGQFVAKDQTLLEYDRRIPEQELKVAQKELEITNSELHRATSLSFKDKEQLSQVGVLKLKLLKEKVRLEIAQYIVDRLNVKAPEVGVVMLKDPEEWRGRPVRVGERILKISNPDDTQLRIWLPEGDNVQLDRDKNIKVIMNVSPEKSYLAKLNYVADYSEINDQQLPSFVAEADWENKENSSLKLGLKGTAILYGDDVTLFYWIVRKPWATLRGFFGF